jgi:RNA-binding protein 26
MILDDNESELLKQWVMKRLEGIEVDGDVMADYVLALVKTDDPEPVLRASSIENLQDFLQDGTEAFVNDIFTAIRTKSYDPSKPAPAPAPGPQDQQPFESRKRALDDDNAQFGRIQSYESGDRPVKQMRRGGGRGGFDARGGRFAQPPMHQQQQQPQWQAPQMPAMPQMGQMPAPPPGMPPYDPNDPMSMFMAMQQAMGSLQGMPGMPSMPSMPAMPGAPPAQKKTGRRCFDYDRKGFCARGASCPYEHGEEAIVAPAADQYDPSNSALPGFPPVDQFNDSGRGGGRGRGRGRGGNFRGGGRRADISIQGQNFDRSNTTIVIEQIPEDKFDEQTIREFFNEFGTIEEVGLQPYKRLATVKYDTYDAAKAAYDSPKVIFDNRFVKVYWHKSDAPYKPSGAGEGDVEMKEQEPQIDPEEFAKRQEEAQRKHEEAMKQRAETEKQRLDVDAKIKAMEAEKKKLAEMLARKGGKTATPAASTPKANGGATPNDPKGLQEQLAKLEAEAQSLGIDPENTTNGWAGASGYRGRGGFRGRGAFRGRGFTPGFRGGYAGGMRGGAVKRLDNRPRTVAIVFPSGTYDQHDEALRQYLLLSNNLEHAELSKHPDRSDAALLAFEERYRAENFMAAAGASSGIPHIGQVELSWQPNPPVTIVNDANGNEAQEDYKMDVSEPNAPAVESMDAFDVADDDDRW